MRFLLLLVMIIGTGCAHVKVELWDSCEDKVAEIHAYGVFRNGIYVVEETEDYSVHIEIARPGLSNNGLKALQVLPELADEIGHTMTQSQAIDAAAEAKLLSGAIQAIAEGAK
jgi:hypothetical protein